MNELLLVWVGRQAEREWEVLARRYVERIRRFVAVDEVRLRPEPGRGHDAARARAAEGDRMLALLRPRDRLVALDERGEEKTTAQLAESLPLWLAVGRVVLAVGSDLGLAPAVVDRAHNVLALSRLTLPHALARVLLLEQVYRALDYHAGGAYHRGEEGWRVVGYNRAPRRHR